MRSWNLIFTLFLYCLLWVGCTKNTSVTGTDYPNTISGAVFDPFDQPLANANVSLRPTDFLYDPEQPAIIPDHYNTNTDEFGNFRLDSIDPGDYSIEITSGDTLSELIEVIIDSSGALEELLIHLEKPASLVGSISLTEHQLIASSTFIQVYGLDRFAPVNDQGEYNISVPTGQYTLRVFSRDTLFKVIDLDSVQAISGEITYLSPYHQWENDINIQLNTTTSGAGITDNLIGFPLLVRLNSGSFNFSNSKPDGSDIRFAKSNGVPLIYEIERWDGLNQMAEVWVKVDTVYGNNESQYFYMYSGNNNVSSQSSGISVFDTSIGFNGVWHLKEQGNSDTLGFKDATGFNNHANGVSLTVDSDSEGIVGPCQDLDGVEDYLYVPDHNSLDMGSDFTFMLWVKWERDSLPVNYPKILYKKNPWQDSSGWGFALGNLDDERIRFVGSDTTRPLIDSVTTWSNSEWIHLTGIYNGNTATLYVNGINKASVTIRAVVDNNEDLFIGQYNPGGKFRWNGKMDEIRISDTIRSPDWVKMNYENQKEGSNVVQIGN